MSLNLENLFPQIVSEKDVQLKLDQTQWLVFWLLGNRFPFPFIFIDLTHMVMELLVNLNACSTMWQDRLIYWCSFHVHVLRFVIPVHSNNSTFCDFNVCFKKFHFNSGFFLDMLMFCLLLPATHTDRGDNGRHYDEQASETKPLIIMYVLKTAWLVITLEWTSWSHSTINHGKMEALTSLVHGCWLLFS